MNQSINCLLTEERVGIKTLKNPKAFIDYSQTIDDVYTNLKDYDPTKKRRVLIVFDDMIADMGSNKKLSPVVTELFLRGRQLNISLVFISQSYFKDYKTKCNTFFYHKNFYQKRTSTNSIKSFV